MASAPHLKAQRLIETYYYRELDKAKSSICLTIDQLRAVNVIFKSATNSDIEYEHLRMIHDIVEKHNFVRVDFSVTIYGFNLEHLEFLR